MPGLNNDSEDENFDFRASSPKRPTVVSTQPTNSTDSSGESTNDYLSKFVTPPPSKRPQMAASSASPPAATENEAMEEIMEDTDNDMDDENENIVTFVTPSKSRHACLNGFR